MILGRSRILRTLSARLLGRLLSIVLTTMLISATFLRAGLPASAEEGSYVVRGVLSRADVDLDGRIAHEFSWELAQGTTVYVRLAGAFDAYLELMDENGDVLRADDDSGGGSDAHIEYAPDVSGVYRLRVTSAAQDETGVYALEVRTQENEARVQQRAQLRKIRVSDEAGPPLEHLPLGTLIDGRLETDGAFATFDLQVPEKGGNYDVWLLGESDFDLFATAIDSNRAGALLEERSEGPFGYEHVQIDVPAGVPSIHIQVVLYGDFSHDGVYYLLAQESISGNVTRRSRLSQGTAPWLSERRSEHMPKRSPFGGQLTDGRRDEGIIDVTRYSTQFWALRVPEGVGRVSVGLFEAAGDMDLSIHPGWSPSPAGFGHTTHGVSKRHNERVQLSAQEGEVSVSPGLYTVAVWSAEDEASEYRIQVAFDTSLPASVNGGLLSTARTGLSGVQRAQLATVRIENDLNEGSGALVTPDGLILTSYHLIADCHPASTVPFGCLPEDESLNPKYFEDEHLVSLLDPRSGRAVQRFVARLERTLPQYDLALLEITSDIDGEPWRGDDGAVQGVGPNTVSLPFVDVRSGDADSALAGLSTLAFGYEGSRFESAAAKVTDEVMWEGRRRLVQLESESRRWHSGGPLVENEDGTLVGVTTRRHHRGFGLDESEGDSLAHPTSLLPREWLEYIERRGGRILHPSAQ